jgi:hypothetical protein
MIGLEPCAIELIRTPMVELEPLPWLGHQWYDLNYVPLNWLEPQWYDLNHMPLTWLEPIW